MNTRRTLISRVAAFVGLGTTVAAVAASPAPQDRRSGNPPQRPDAVSGDVQQHGLVPNDPAAAAANARALKALVSPTGNFAGRVWFPNTTGADIYYLDDIVPFHDGIQVDLQGCTLHFSKAGARSDTNSGFIFAIRDFSIANGTIVVDYQMGGGGTNAGNALTFGNRGEDSMYFSPVYDSMLATPMGNIAVRNLRISSNTRGGNGIYMIGGLCGVVFENVWVDGANGALVNGIYYEFGWATNDRRRELRQTSHAHNMRFSNINIANLNTKEGAGLTLNGAYSCWVDGLYVRSAKVAFACSPGESSFFRPWNGVDQVGAKRNIAVRNLVGSGITGTAIAVDGVASKAGGYLHVTQNGPAQETDLMDFSLDGFAVDGGNLDGGYGIQSSAEKLDIRNGRITNFSRGIMTTHDCTRLSIDSVDIFGCRQCGMLIGQQSSIWNPPRQKMGFIRNCFIAGNGVESPGTFAAIELDQCAAFTIEGNRFGFEPGHDGIEETAQGLAVRIGAASSNVVCRSNHTGGIHAAGVAYKSLGSSQGNAIQHASGVASTAGSWEVTNPRR